MKNPPREVDSLFFYARLSARRCVRPFGHKLGDFLGRLIAIAQNVLHHRRYFNGLPLKYR